MGNRLPNTIVCHPSLIDSPTHLHTNMIIPFQQIFTSALLGVGMLKKGGSISEGKILDFCKEECLDSDMKQHCTAPFLLKKSTCHRDVLASYNIAFILWHVL